MRKLFLSALLLSMGCSFCFSQVLAPELEDPTVNSINRLPAREEVCLNLDLRQLGLGGASCGPKPLDKYIFPIQKESYSITISPYRR